MFEIHTLTCKSCRAPLDSRHIDRRNRLAQCPYCGTLADLSHLFPETSMPAAQQPAERPPVPLPETITVERLPNGLRLTHKPQNKITLIIIGLFLLFFPLMLLFLPLLYYMLNKTTLVVQGGWLTIEYGPHPWFNRHQRYPLSEIAQLYVKKKTSYSEHGPNITYEVHALLTSHRDIKLVTNLTEPEQGLYIEQEIERYLGLRDHPVAGELSRR